MVSVFLMGGLGNQMFQYAFARSLALKRGDSLQLAARHFFRNDSFGRSYALNNLNIPFEVKIMPAVQEFLAFHKANTVKELKKLLNSFKKVKDFYTDSIIYQFGIFDRYDPELMRYNFGKNVTILGGFQAWKYFQDYAVQIKNELKVLTPPSPENERMIEELTSCESICVHVRRGDYLTENFVNVCNYDYYNKAMKYIAEKTNSPIFYFFSNDHNEIEWLKNNWSFPDFNVKYVNLDNSDYEELRLMYSCRHFIIANSSFSWWGSYLSGNPEKIICAPSKWVDERPIEETNIFMPDWKII